MDARFLERTGFTHSWSEEMHYLVVENAWNGESIDWGFWGSLPNITPIQAAKLYWCIDPLRWPDSNYALGVLPDEWRIKIEQLTQFLKGRSNAWSLSDLLSVLGFENAPFGMIQVVKQHRLDEAKKRSSIAQPLDLLSDEATQNYYKQAAWSWIDAIYILQGYRPVFQLDTEQVRAHFPSLVTFFTQSIQLGKIGKEIIQAGEKTFIDSPANWRVFWDSVNQAKPIEQPEVFEDIEIDYRDEPLNENALNEINVEYWTEQAAAIVPRVKWLEKLKLDEEKVKEIEKACKFADSRGLHAEQVNAYANLAALTSRAEKYFEGVDTILRTELKKPTCMDERTKLFVWRHVLKANEFDSTAEEFQIIRNQQLLSKIAEIDGLLEIESVSLETETNATKSEADTETISSVSQTKRGNDIAISNLLNAPTRQDDWFEVINDMTKDFYLKFGQVPNAIQAWGWLCTTPPAGYSITTGKDKGGEDCLMMPGVKSLGKRSFDERWKKYTAPTSE
ncbi:hypothetical protein NP603_05310 [Methylomonas sp. SURF-1]|uniref:Uncharacterized protein n=1 Tax=Methylomonas aurea TaxID=2952224 RepID=A0ABT1UFM3_9GAMM|nr:hypothetical protein [Methylomonas sp. SURF-1]MCQ8180514.1 hypothetical protein [Methylomonas sp. SURF-1]